MGLYLNNYTDSTWSTTEEDCVRVIGGGDYCSDVSKCRVSARGACRECVVYPSYVGFSSVCIS